MTKLLRIISGVITEQDVAVGGAGGSVSFVTVPFTDGDTMQRVTVTDSSVTATSKILVSVQRPDITSDSADAGYIYFVNVINRTAGVSFDVVIICTDWGLSDPVEAPPNETITLCYMIG